MWGDNSGGKGLRGPLPLWPHVPCTTTMKDCGHRVSCHTLSALVWELRPGSPWILPNGTSPPGLGLRPPASRPQPWPGLWPLPLRQGRLGHWLSPPWVLQDLAGPCAGSQTQLGPKAPKASPNSTSASAPTSSSSPSPRKTNTVTAERDLRPGTFSSPSYQLICSSQQSYEPGTVIPILLKTN